MCVRKMLKDFNFEELMGEPEDDACLPTGQCATDSHPQDKAGCALYRDRIAAAILEVNAKSLFGHAIIHDQLSQMIPDEINTLYAEYTARMGQSMGKGISQLAIKTYTSLVKKVFPVGDHNALQGEPNNNPVLQHASSIIAGEAYHKFGFALAPLSVMFNTIQHVDITRPVWVKQELNLI